MPEAAVAVRFLDTAPPARQRGPAVELGLTDKSGVLDRRFEYTWSDYFAASGRPDAGTFDVLIGAQVFHATVECLRIVEGERELSLDVVWSKVIVIE